jgi:hypothetical protein
MRHTRVTKLAAATVTAVALLGVSACGGDSDEKSEPKTSASAEPTEAEESEPAAAEGQPKWANPATSGGELVSTIKLDNGITVEAYQLGTEKATKSGQFVDPDTNKPIIAEGDDVVFVNYVVSNTGDPIDLGSSLVSISARYDDWPYLQGMDSVVDDTLFEKQGVNDDAMTPDAFVDPSIYTFGTGEKYSFGENFPYQAGSPITFKVDVTPVDAEGELLHDKRVEAEGTGTIK